MRPREIVEALPFSQLSMKVYVTGVRQQLVELLLVGPVRPLDLAIELRGAWLDVGMTDALVLDMPMELGLELMAIVGPHLADPEGEPGNDVVDEGDRIGLGVPVVDLERPDAGRIINGGILIAFDRFAVLSLKDQELDVDLDLVPGDLLLIALGMDLTNPRAARKPVQAIAPENAIDAGIRDLDVVIARQIPDDPNGSQVVSPPQM